MKRILLLFTLILQGGFASASMAYNSTNHLLDELEALPHDTTQLRLWEKLVLTEQSSPHYIEYAEQMFKEAQLQKSDKYIAGSTYYKLLHYYNKNQTDSIKKLINYLMPIAERMEYWQMYFNTQKLLIYTYIHEEKFEFAINEALKMQKKAEALNYVNGHIAAYLCLTNAYHETNRKEEEGKILEKAYKLLTDSTHNNTKISVLEQLIIFSNDRKDYINMGTYLKQNAQLVKKMLEEHPEMHKSYHNLLLFSETYYTNYFIGIEKADSARLHMEKARDYITPQSFSPYIVSYFNACARYYKHLKDYQRALLYIDSTLTNTQKPEFRKMDYARQLTHKANLLQAMGQYRNALPLYERSNQIQDSLAAVISAKQLEEIREIHQLNQLVWEQGKLENRIQFSILLILGVILILCIFYMHRINRIRKALKISEKETQKATQQSEEANEIKNRFLSNMSHTIRVPLNGVLGFSQIITNETDLDEDNRKEYANIIQEDTERLMRLVNNVLDLSRLEAGMMKFQLSDYDIVQLCNDCVGTARLQNPTVHIHFHCNINEHIIHTDCSRLMQVIISTLTCPLASFKEERDIHFTLKKKGETLCFKVINSTLADPKFIGHGSTLRNDVNRLFLKYFGGTYQIVPDSKEGIIIFFTYPATAID